MMWIILYDVADACCKPRVIIKIIRLHTYKKCIEGTKGIINDICFYKYRQLRRNKHNADVKIKKTW